MMQKYEWSRKDAEELAAFLTPMLDYVPEKRATAKQCLQHPWLKQENDDDQKSGDDGSKSEEKEENLTDDTSNTS